MVYRSKSNGGFRWPCLAYRQPGACPIRLSPTRIGNIYRLFNTVVIRACPFLPLLCISLYVPSLRSIFHEASELEPFACTAHSGFCAKVLMFTEIHVYHVNLRQRISAYLFRSVAFSGSHHLENKAESDEETITNFSSSLLSIPTLSPEIALFRTFEYLGSTKYYQWLLGYGCIWSFVTPRGRQQRAGVESGEEDDWDIWNGLIEKVAAHQGYYLNFGIPSASSLLHKPGWKQLSKSGGLFVHPTEFVVRKL